MNPAVLPPKKPRYSSQYTAITSNEDFLRILNTYNLYYEGQHEKLVVNKTNDQLFVDGVLKIHWGLRLPIYLKREEPTWKRKSVRTAFENGLDEEELMLTLGETSRSRRVDDLTEVDGQAGWNKFAPPRPNSDITEGVVKLLDPLSQGQVEWMGPRNFVGNGSAGVGGSQGRAGKELAPLFEPDRTDGQMERDWAEGQKTAGTLEAGGEVRGQGGGGGGGIKKRRGGVKKRQSLGKWESGEMEPAAVAADSLDYFLEEVTPRPVGVVRRAQTFREPQPARRQVTVGRHRSFHDKKFLQQDALKRRASFGGHLYKQKTRIFTPQYGTLTTLRAESTMTTPHVIAMLLKKFAVENSPDEFSLYTIRENGETHKLKDEDYPLLVRVLQGPGEDVAKIFIMENSYDVDISHEVAQYINLELPTLKGILEKFQEEEEREVENIKEKYDFYKRLLEAKLDKISTQV